MFEFFSPNPIVQMSKIKMIKNLQQTHETEKGNIHLKLRNFLH